MPESFVFLELIDPEINGLLYSIREAANGSAENTNIHITLRGPYAKPVPAAQLKNIERRLLQDVLYIGNPGEFRVQDTSVVYLRVRHPKLRAVSWKPDFPPKEFGFNPHISLYIGRDFKRADRLLEFLRGERIELICQNFKVTNYVRKAPRLLSDDQNIQFFYPRLISSGRVRSDLLSRLKRALGPMSSV